MGFMGMSNDADDDASTVEAHGGVTGFPAHRYLELDNVRPNHRASRAVGRTLTRWIDAAPRRRTRQALALVEETEGVVMREPSWGGVVTMREVHDEEEMGLGLLDKFVTRLVG